MYFLTPKMPLLARRSNPLWLFCIIAVFELGQLCAAADKSAADYFISSLPGQPEGPLLKMHAG